MNRLQHLFETRKSQVLSVFFTAGFPKLHSTPEILKALESQGLHFAEIGIPFSDPLADGPVIQQCSTKAIQNGMTLQGLLEELTLHKGQIKIPYLLIGYLNPVMQFGMEDFCQKASAAGVSAVILPDLPPEVYQREYEHLFQKYELPMVFLITPHTSDERIRKIDTLSKGFIYAVSTAATTGGQDIFGEEQSAFFQRIGRMKLQNPVMVGFGIHNAQNLQTVWAHLQGAITGTAFLRHLENSGNPSLAVEKLLCDLNLDAASLCEPARMLIVK